MTRWGHVKQNIPIYLGYFEPIMIFVAKTNRNVSECP